MHTDALLEVRGLTISVGRDKPVRDLVHDLHFRVGRGQSLGLVGESGSGKSLTAMALLRLLPWPEVTIRQGQILFQNRDLVRTNERELQKIRGRSIAAVFQDALGALNPVRRLASQMEELFSFHPRVWTLSQQRKRILEALQFVGLEDGAALMQLFPHQLSGGMRQRLVLAMAIVLEPDLLIADEPTTALDVTRQAQVIRLLRRMQVENGMGVIFVSHDLALVAELCQQTLVLYRGHMMEHGPTEALLTRPRHPYTRSMLAALPLWGLAPQGLKVEASGESTESVSGCVYQHSCPYRLERCQQEKPVLRLISDQHQVACHRAEEDLA